MYRSNPIEVLNHSAKHGYNSLADIVAPLTVSKSIKEVIDGLKFPGLALRWVSGYLPLSHSVSSHEIKCNGFVDEIF